LQKFSENKMVDEEQKGCSKGSVGCKEQVIVDDSIIMGQWG
jgi:hypothetical protein